MVSKTMSVASLPDPRLHLVGRHLGEVAPALLNPPQDLLFLDVPLLKQEPDLLLHRTAALCRDLFETFDDRLGDAANGQGCHILPPDRIVHSPTNRCKHSASNWCVSRGGRSFRHGTANSSSGFARSAASRFRAS